MRKTVTLLFFIATFCFQASGQDQIKNFGKPDMKELQMTVYPKDRNAEAVILFNFGKTNFVSFGGDLELVFEQTTRIKILTEEGVRQGEIEIPYYYENNNSEIIYDLEAYTYNDEDGRAVPSALELSNVFDEKLNNRWMVKKFTMPKVKKGSVIEYRYKIRSPYLFNLKDWEFQAKIPVVYSEYEVKMVPFYDYVWFLQGAGKFDVYESYEDLGSPRSFGIAVSGYRDNVRYDILYRFGMKDIPGFYDEQFISSINDYIIKINFQLARINRSDGYSQSIMTTWPDLTKELLNDNEFGKYVKKSRSSASKLIDVKALKSASDEEKFNAVMDYVKANYNWNGNYGYMSQKSVSKLLSEKHGSVADLNLFAVGLLESVGIEAYPVIISTRGHGTIKNDYPFKQAFNYVIIYAKVNNQVILADATSVMSKNNRIPVRCINDKGLIVKKGDIEWIGLECLFPTEINKSLNISLNDDAMWEADINIKASEYDALRFRSIFRDNTEKINERLKTEYPHVDEEKTQVKNALERNLPYFLNYLVEDNVEHIQNKLYLSPFLNEIIKENPLKQATRLYPVDMIYPERKTYTATIQVPAGYKIDFIPQNQSVNNDLFELAYNVMNNGDKLTVSMSYFFKKAIYDAKDYSKVKVYFNQIVTKGQEKIVFVKAE